MFILFSGYHVALSKNQDTFTRKQIPENLYQLLLHAGMKKRTFPCFCLILLIQDYRSRTFELIVVNDNSSDSTFETASGFTGIKNLKVLNSNGRGKKKAIRTGIEASAGKCDYND